MEGGRTGARIVVDCLLEQGVDTVFGYPGGNILQVYDELDQRRDRITHILTAHEQGACHAADGYARSTGRPGVVIATSGPGAANLITGIATAYMDSVPMVILTGNVPTPWRGKDSFQEIDMLSLSMSVTKHNFYVADVEQLEDTLRRAFLIAGEGRPGPVLVDIPKDVQARSCTRAVGAPMPRRRIPSITGVELQQALVALCRAEKPFIYAGGGVIRADAAAELREFADRLDAPVACSLMGLGAMPWDDARYTGMVGMHGTPASNHGISQCDLLVVVGARFSDRVM
ncbi:MAG: thiamine pyrophosphate-binding protein, partial [Eubacteriales bacterium]|nr:thiamine pyrophosphate-binding protein [Eubacteriales bacterium]